MAQNEATQILVIEDNADDSFLLYRQLAKAQIDDHVTLIGNGKEALDFLLQLSVPPLVIFLDLKLPGLNGIEVLERIRQEARFKTVPVIIMTGSDNPSDLEKCSNLGVTSYLSKPIGLTTFIKTVAHLFPKITVPE